MRWCECDVVWHRLMCLVESPIIQAPHDHTYRLKAVENEMCFNDVNSQPHLPIRCSRKSLSHAVQLLILLVCTRFLPKYMILTDICIPYN